MSDGDILTKSIIHQLVRHSVDEARVSREVVPEWSLLFHGVQLWQAYAGSDSLPQWQTEVIRWLYRDAPAIAQGERAPSSADLALLCRVYSVWEYSLPLDPTSSIYCISPQWQLHLRYMRPSPQQLEELVYLFELEDESNRWTDNRMKRLAAVTVVEYLVATSGRDRLPLLIEGMRHFRTWQELAPAVTGLSAAEFEAGWQAYVANRYGPK